MSPDIEADNSHDSPQSLARQIERDDRAWSRLLAERQSLRLRLQDVTEEIVRVEKRIDESRRTLTRLYYLEDLDATDC